MWSLSLHLLDTARKLHKHVHETFNLRLVSRRYRVSYRNRDSRKLLNLMKTLETKYHALICHHRVILLFFYSSLLHKIPFRSYDIFRLKKKLGWKLSKQPNGFPPLFVGWIE